jgi:hypothetical protein
MPKFIIRGLGGRKLGEARGDDERAAFGEFLAHEGYADEQDAVDKRFASFENVTFDVVPDA